MTANIVWSVRLVTKADHYQPTPQSHAFELNLTSLSCAANLDSHRDKYRVRTTSTRCTAILESVGLKVYCETVVDMEYGTSKTTIKTGMYVSQLCELCHGHGLRRGVGGMWATVAH
jgi:hypothetical protein